MISEEGEAIRKTAQSYRKTFDFFIVSLQFGVLAFAAHNRIDSGAIAIRVVEVLAWLTLLGSCVVSIRRLELQPSLFEARGDLYDHGGNDHGGLALNMSEDLATALRVQQVANLICKQQLARYRLSNMLFFFGGFLLVILRIVVRFIKV